MIITCEECNTSFKLDESLLKPSGSKLRCSKCGHIFVAYPSPSDEISAPEPEEKTPPAAGETAEAAAAPETASEAQAETETETETESGPQTEAETEPSAPAEDEESLFEEDAAAAGTGPVAETAAEKDAAPVEDFDLSDLDLSTPETEIEEESAAVEDFDLSDLEQDLVMESDTEVSRPPEEASAAEPPEGEAEDDGGDFDLESLLEESDTDAAEMQEEEPLLEFEMGDEAEPSEETTEETDKTLDLSDLGDLDLDLEEDEASPRFEMEEDESQDEELELDLDFDLEEAPATTQEAAPETEAESLDLPDLEETIEMASPPSADSTTAEETSDINVGLEMENGSEAAAVAKETPEDAEDEDLEDLDFELDMEFEAETEEADAAPDEAVEGVEDLDMSEIEAMLGDTAEDVGLAEPGDEDLDDQVQVEKWKEKPADADLEETAEIDLTDLNLDEEEKGLTEEEELDLELELEAKPDTEAAQEEDAAAEPSAVEEEEEEEESFLEMETGDAELDRTSGEGDIQLEFDIDDEEEADAGTTEEVMEKSDVPLSEMATVGTDTVPGAPLKEPKKVKKSKKPKKPKKKTSIGRRSAALPIGVVLLVIVAAAAAVIVLDRFKIQIPYVTDAFRQIPYVEQIMQPASRQGGEITTLDIGSKFIENSSHGKLFIITGTVKNDYPQNRRHIQMSGKLYAKGKKLVKSETVYAGNLLSDKELSEMTRDAIAAHLSKPNGDRNSNAAVKPGQQIPFMVVFAELPPDLEEFTIEVAGSSPVAQ